MSNDYRTYTTATFPDDFAFVARAGVAVLGDKITARALAAQSVACNSPGARQLIPLEVFERRHALISKPRIPQIDESGQDVGVAARLAYNRNRHASGG